MYAAEEAWNHAKNLPNKYAGHVTVPKNVLGTPGHFFKKKRESPGGEKKRDEWEPYTHNQVTNEFQNSNGQI